MSNCIVFLFNILLFYNFFLIAGIIMTWIPGLYKFKIFRIIARISDWYMGPFADVIIIGPIDFTPIIGFMIYDAIIYAVSYLL